MTRLTYKETPYGVREHTGDILRIQCVLRKEGYTVSEDDAARAWADFSESYAAGWLTMRGEDDDYIYNAVISRLGEV